MRLLNFEIFLMSINFLKIKNIKQGFQHNTDKAILCS